MKPAQPLGLVTPGALSNTLFAAFPGIAKALTHVSAPTLRVGQRVVNRMYFARACATLAELIEVRVLFVCDEQRLAMVEALHADWHGRVVILALDDAAPGRDADAGRFRQRGASVAHLAVASEISPPRFFLEGDAAAVAKATEILTKAGALVTAVTRGGLAHLRAARLLSGPVLLGLFESVSQHMRLAGMPLEASRELLGRMVTETVRIHQRSGARKWRASEAEVLSALVVAIGEVDPALAEHLHLSADAVRAFFSSPTASRRARQKKDKQAKP